MSLLAGESWHIHRPAKIRNAPQTEVRSHQKQITWGGEMGFWSKMIRRKEDFVFSDAPPSQYLREALQEAENQPLDDFTWRIVVASQNRHWIIDITLLQAGAGFTAYARGGVQKARHNAASMVLEAIKGRPIDDATMASASLAFFDADFTVGANKGRTRETAWNHRLTFPFGPLLLDYVEVLNRFTGGMK